LDHYVDSVAIWMGDTKVGEADINDFDRDSGTPDEYTANIALSNAVVRENDDENFYVVVDAVSGIDSSGTAADNDRGADITVGINSVRYTDGTGAILTENGNVSGDFQADTVIATDTFGFDSASADDQIDLKSSSANPDDTTVQVDEDDNTDDVLALAYKLDVDEDSDDVMINSLPVHIAVTKGAADTSVDSIENIIDSVTVDVNGKKYDADLDTDNVTDGDGSADYSVDFDDDEFTIDSGDTAEVKVYISFKDQDGNYTENTVVTASVDNDDIEAETANDDIDVGGSAKTGADLTLNTSAAEVDVTSATSDANNDGTSGTFTFKFTVSADNGDVDVTTANTTHTILGPASGRTVTATLVNLDGKADENTAGSDYTVEEGDTRTFSYTVTITPSTTAGNGAYYVRLDQAAGTTVSNETAGPESLATTVTP
jgi:hypothetical protein